MINVNLIELGKRRIRLQFTDDTGGNYSISLDGNVTKENVFKIVEVMELISGENISNIKQLSEETAFGRVFNLIEKSFPLGSFNSNDILEAYEDSFNNTIKISTVSTYLSRLSEKGLLKRQRNGDSWVYRRVRLGIKNGI